MSPKSNTPKTPKRSETPTTESPIVITLTIHPFKNGKRTIVLSAAPEGEMPELRVGTFAQMHALLDDVWLAVHKRKAQVVTKPSAAKAQTTAPKAKKDEETDADDTAEDRAADEEADSPVADATDTAEFEATVQEAAQAEADETQGETVEADQLVRNDAEGAIAPIPEEPLPIIRGDWQQTPLTLE